MDKCLNAVFDRGSRESPPGWGGIEQLGQLLQSELAYNILLKFICEQLSIIAVIDFEEQEAIRQELTTGVIYYCCDYFISNHRFA